MKFKLRSFSFTAAIALFSYSSAFANAGTSQKIQCQGIGDLKLEYSFNFSSGKAFVQDPSATTAVAIFFGDFYVNRIPTEQQPVYILSNLKGLNIENSASVEKAGLYAVVNEQEPNLAVIQLIIKGKTVSEEAECVLP